MQIGRMRQDLTNATTNPVYTFLCSLDFFQVYIIHGASNMLHITAVFPRFYIRVQKYQIIVVGSFEVCLNNAYNSTQLGFKEFRRTIRVHVSSHGYKTILGQVRESCKKLSLLRTLS